MYVKFTAVLVIGWLSAQEVAAEDWPQWRGPERNGVSREKGWSDQWPKEGPPIAWKAAVGLGFSSVVVSSGKAVTAGHANETDTVVCFDALTGKELWKHSYPAELGDKYYEGGTTGTATFEGERVFALRAVKGNGADAALKVPAEMRGVEVLRVHLAFPPLARAIDILSTPSAT